METDDCLLNFLRCCSKTNSMDVTLDGMIKVGASMLLGMTISCSSVSESQPRHFLWVYNPSVLDDQSFFLKRKHVNKLLLTLLDGKGGSQSFKHPSMNKKNKETTRAERWFRSVLTIKKCNKRLTSFHTLRRDIVLCLQSDGSLRLWKIITNQRKYPQRGHKVTSLMENNIVLFDPGSVLISSCCLWDAFTSITSQSQQRQHGDEDEDIDVYMLMWVQKKNHDAGPVAEEYLCRVSYMKV